VVRTEGAAQVGRRHGCRYTVPVNHEQDHYAVLELPETASQSEVKQSYRRLMREVHPDANVDDPHATRKAASINHAFETLGNIERRRAYDERRRPAGTRPTVDSRIYAYWAEHEDWEDIVAETVPPPRPPHVHALEPTIEPEEIEVTVDELDASPRVRRRIRITNNCDCTLVGDVATSEPWVWGPIGEFRLEPDQSVEFDVEIVSRKVAFPGLSRVLFVTNDWTGVIPVRITGYRTKPRPVRPSADMQYARNRYVKRPRQARRY
jgi:hypothetical protein